MIRFISGICTLVVCIGTTGLVAQNDIYDPNTITEIRITFTNPSWADSLQNLKEDPSQPRLLADLRVNDVLYPSVGVRYKGNSSYNAVQRKGKQKLPFNIKVDYQIEGQLLPGGYNRLKLSNGFRDPSMIREVLGYEIARSYMPASQANFARVFINEEYFGLYTSVESVDAHFLLDQFGDNQGTFLKCDPVWGYQRPAECPEGDKSSLQYLGQQAPCYQGLYEMKSDSGWSDLIDLTKVLHQNTDNLDQVLDIDQTLWWLAFNNVMINLDSYQGAFCHNYYLYQDKEGTFHPVIWDLNLAFGGFSLLGLPEQKSLDAQGMEQMSMFIHYKQQNAKRPLITKVLSNDLYRKMYVAHIETILNDYFSAGQLEKRANELQAIVKDAVLADTKKLYSDSAFTQNLWHTEMAGSTPIVGILELMEARASYLRNHKLIQKADPEILEPVFEEEEEAIRVRVQMKGTESGWIFYRNGKHGRFDKRAMVLKASLHEDQGSDGWVWYEAMIPKNGDSRFDCYFVAEARVNATVLPSRSGTNYFTYGEK